MEYISTRNKKNIFSFKDIFLKGLAPDGGLFIPKEIIPFTEKELNELKNLSYKKLATKIILKFCGKEFKEEQINEIVDDSYKDFRTKDIVKIVEMGNLSLLELFHGPTLAFKDIALQIIENMYERILKKNNSRITIIVATSGDTGAAAISAIKNRSNMKIFVLHPENKISDVQRKFMTTVSSKNVFNIALASNFDECQKFVKLMFADKNFNKSINMAGVNSINWVRIVLQTVYYFFSYFKISKNNEKINFSVPTGNFGDVYAGYLAKKMGLPINKLIVATNQNDILHRAISNGIYEVENVFETLSPSMDIQVASNFERLLYDLNEGDDLQTIDAMKNIKEKGKYIINQEKLDKINTNFLSSKMSEEEVLKTINAVYKKFNVVLDPHSAIGYGAFDKINLEGNNIVLATAHPCKFPDAIKKAIDIKVDLPKELMFVMDEKENYDIIDNDIEKIKQHIKERIQ